MRGARAREGVNARESIGRSTVLGRAPVDGRRQRGVGRSLCLRVTRRPSVAALLPVRPERLPLLARCIARPRGSVPPRPERQARGGRWSASRGKTPRRAGMTSSEVGESVSEQGDDIGRGRGGRFGAGDGVERGRRGRLGGGGRHRATPKRSVRGERRALRRPLPDALATVSNITSPTGVPQRGGAPRSAGRRARSQVCSPYPGSPLPTAGASWRRGHLLAPAPVGRCPPAQQAGVQGGGALVGDGLTRGRSHGGERPGISIAVDDDPSAGSRWSRRSGGSRCRREADHGMGAADARSSADGPGLPSSRGAVMRAPKEGDPRGGFRSWRALLHGPRAGPRVSQSKELRPCRRRRPGLAR